MELIYLYDVNLTLTEAILENNQANEYGGGIFLINDASLTMINSTVTEDKRQRTAVELMLMGPTTGQS